ncbi:hypothetical protein FB45DRAFT_900505 [Roridomyces roridus]|uniref:Uncharacterized protein n=1 Tax=Roridomyces roridus TaxID=1738132 RepID=A0AAD7C7R3_9AGAR|nr:hypothetical protein FB45DRAFT_900505 [Roridomyces roridus]
MSSTDDTRAAIRKTITSFLDAYIAAVEQPDKSSELLMRDLTPSCMRFIRPAAMVRSFGLDPAKGEDRDTYAARMKGELLILATARINIVKDSVIIDAENSCAAFRSEHWLTLKGRPETMLEFAWFMDFDKDAKIEKIVQVIDLAECVKYVETMKEVAKELGGLA